MFPIYEKTGNARLFTNVDHVVHNLYLYVLGEVGIIGFLTFLAIFVAAAISADRSRRAFPLGQVNAAIAIGACIGLVAHLMHGLFDPGFKLSLGISELVSVAWGLIAAIAMERRRTGADDGRSKLDRRDDAGGPYRRLPRDHSRHRSYSLRLDH